jgi:hypothetical protein
MKRLLHDFAHRASIRLLGVVAAALRPEEFKDYYDEAMGILLEEIEALDARRQREAIRLAPTAHTKEGG